jgi:polyphosphate:AMP phosphotransferase
MSARRTRSPFEKGTARAPVPRAEYDGEVARLRWELLNAQQALRGATFPLIVLFGGADGAGKRETVHLLNEWMDPRWIVNRAFDEPSQDERERPPFWRYWLALPARGQIGLFLSAWYSSPLVERVHRRTTSGEFNEQMERIARFERVLADDGAVILKFWMHLDRDAQRERLRSLEDDPLTRWRVTKTQWSNWKRYDDFIDVTERLIDLTDVPHAPWTVVDGRDERHRNLLVGTRIRDALHDRLHLVARRGRRPVTRAQRAPARPAPVALPRRRIPDVIKRVDTARTVSKEDYKTNLELLQGRLNRLQREAAAEGRALVLVFEGWDAAGKGGAIRRLVSALEPRAYRIYPIAAPTDEERAQHYLWRFWRHIPRAGRVAVFDRSWYGRVLVERIEGFATESEWKRAYAEINDFERQLTDHGAVVVKYWLHITREEQERRFNERARSPYKSWKLSAEDWRNRARWKDYEVAVNEMVARTSTPVAPWHLVAANDKNAARLEVLKRACEGLRGKRATAKAHH